jgi:hypothetical protein
VHISHNNTITPDPALPQAVEHYESLMKSEVGDLTTQNQSNLILVLHSRARATLLAGADLLNSARLLSLTLPQAHSWLLAVPYKPTLQLYPNEFRQSARYRLGESDHNHLGNLRCRQCDKVQNPRDQGLSYGTTQLNAMVEAPFTAATTASKITYHTLKAAGYSPQLETAHLMPDSLIRPGDVYVMTAWQLHMTSLWSHLLWNRPYLRPRALSASRRIRQNAGKPSTTRTIALVREYNLFL